MSSKNRRKVEIVEKLLPECWPWFYRGKQVLGAGSTRADVIDTVFANPKIGIKFLERMIEIEHIEAPPSALPRGNRHRKAARPGKRT